MSHPTPNSTRSGLPAHFEPLTSLSYDAPFEQWQAALAQSGFALLFESQSHDDSWPDGADPLGPVPEPQSYYGTRRHAILAHPDGFVLKLISGPGVQHSDGSANEAARAVQEAVFYHQTNIGANISDTRLAFGSGGRSSLGNGASVYTGYEQISSPEGLVYFLKECHREAYPVPLAQWTDSSRTRSSILIEHGLFSSTPSNCAFGGPQFESLRERFKERLARDWLDFVSALPSEVASRVDATGVARGLGGQPAFGPDLLYAISTSNYFASQLKALGQNWPNDRDSDIMSGWSRAIAQAKSDPEGSAPLQFDHARERVVGGANALHALACFHQHPSDAERAVGVARRWIDAQRPEDLEALLTQRDARGRTPAGLAFEVWMRDGALGRDEAPVARVIDLFLERGWLGAPGEFAQIAYDTLTPSPAQWSHTVTPAALGHAIALDRVERAASGSDSDWLVPLVHAEGVALNRCDAIDALSSKFGNARSDALAYLEALALRAEIIKPVAPSASYRL